MVLVAYHAGERCSPLRIIRASLPCRKIATLFADLHLLRDRSRRCRFLCSDTTFHLISPLLRAFFYFNLHRLVGLRRLRLCLILRLGLCPQTPTMGFTPNLTRGVPLDLLSFASLGVGAQLWSALPIPNSSFLIPHSSLLTFYTCI